MPQTTDSLPFLLVLYHKPKVNSWRTTLSVQNLQGQFFHKRILRSTLSVLRGHSVMPALYHQAIEEAVTEAISLDLS